jgi:hypothetical protein
MHLDVLLIFHKPSTLRGGKWQEGSQHGQSLLGWPEWLTTNLKRQLGNWLKQMGLEGTGAAANNTWYTFVRTGPLVIIIIRRQFKKLNNTRHGLKLGTGWDASIGYLVPLQHKTRMILLLGPTCLNSSSHLGIRWLGVNMARSDQEMEQQSRAHQRKTSEQNKDF